MISHSITLLQTPRTSQPSKSLLPSFPPSLLSLVQKTSETNSGVRSHQATPKAQFTKDRNPQTTTDEKKSRSYGMFHCCESEMLKQNVSKVICTPPLAASFLLPSSRSLHPSIRSVPFLFFPHFPSFLLPSPYLPLTLTYSTLPINERRIALPQSSAKPAKTWCPQHVTDHERRSEEEEEEEEDREVGREQGGSKCRIVQRCQCLLACKQISTLASFVPEPQPDQE